MKNVDPRKIDFASQHPETVPSNNPNNRFRYLTIIWIVLGLLQAFSSVFNWPSQPLILVSGVFFIIAGINLSYRKRFVTSKINRLILFPLSLIVIFSIFNDFIVYHVVAVLTIGFLLPIFFGFFVMSFGNSRVISELRDGFELLDNFKYQEAFDYFNEYIDLNHNNPVALSGISWSLIGLKRYDEALEYSIKAVEIPVGFNKLMEMQAINIIRFYTRSAVLFHLKRYDTALYNADIILKIGQSINFMGWNLKVLIFDEMGNHEESMKCYKNALRYSPKYAVKLPNNFDNSQNLINQFNTLIKFYKPILNFIL
jgi:tetratricopeptide (TPR) repeat protein